MSFFQKEDMVDLVVGAEEETFHVHAKVLKFVPFFERALNGGFAESLSRSIKMPDDRPNTMHCALCWLYAHEVPGMYRDSERTLIDHLDHDEVNLALALAKLEVLAHKLNMPHLEQVALEELERDISTLNVGVREALTPDLVQYVYANTTRGSSPRNCLVQCVLHRHDETFKSHFSNFITGCVEHECSEFLGDLAVLQQEQLERLPKKKPSLGDDGWFK